MNGLGTYLTTRVNHGNFLTNYSHGELEKRVENEPMVLPICSLGTPFEELAEMAPLVLPPLYHEALDLGLKERLIGRIRQCFPYFEGTRKRARFGGTFEIVELPPRPLPPAEPAALLAFSIDTAVEEHGPHLPLATDRIQSYAVLRRLSEELPDLRIAPPAEYGQLTWGLPFGLSIDITAGLLTEYVARFVDALMDWHSPGAVYAVCVHGSVVHQNAILEGLKRSRCRHFSFRWLHEPLVEFAGRRGDQHAGGVETAIMNRVSPLLVDQNWFPSRSADLVGGQMQMEKAVELSPDLARFIAVVEAGSFNGIVGDIDNYFRLDPDDLFERMLEVSRLDTAALLAEARGRS